MIQLALALESLGPMGAQVIHLFFCFCESVGPFWGPSDPLVFSRSSCQVLFGSVLSYFQESLLSVSFSLLLLTEELLTRVSYLSLQKKGQKKRTGLCVCVFLLVCFCLCVCVCVCVLLFSCQYLVSFFLWPLLFLYSTDQY